MTAISGRCGERRWVLKSEARNYFLCAAGEDPRAALCVFRTREDAEGHLENLSESKIHLDTLERYGTEMPVWMGDASLVPEPREVSTEDLRSILAATGVEYVAAVPEGEPEPLEVTSAEEFLRGETG